ncbi:MULTISPECIES: CrcB family protein [unclassified Moraxella]|uniref:CrcB family protein n=1 Tax=unclassified Moraxella TaxID=2685852 RepID=UPI003AF767C8
MQWLLIGLGAGVGAVLRAILSRFNGLHPWLPIGTLLANVLGGLLMGVALVYVERLSPTWRGLITTGFLGGLTTFSTFSAEVFGLFGRGQWGQGAMLVVLHVVLTLCATAVGFFVVRYLTSW